MVGAMLPRETRSGWLIHAPAKLNVYLNVLGKRPDGYHDIETLICPVRVFDTLLIEPTRDATPGSVALSVDRSGARGVADDTPADDDNLVVRALRALWSACGVAASCRVRLVKRIPTQAGLGGGSSDAAAALVAANRVWRLGFGVAELERVASQVGSDVPGLVHGQPVVCRGRGERVEPAAIPAGVPCVIVRPEAGLSTAAVYRRCEGDMAPDPSRLTSLQEAWRAGRLDRLRGLMSNALQPAAESLSHVIGAVRTMFSEAPFVAHQMTGSGSAYFGVCSSDRHARRIAAWLRSQRVGWVRATSTC